MATTNNEDTFNADMADATRRNIETLRNTPPDDTYKSEWNRFVKWMQEHGQAPDDEGRWLTKDNLQLYYSTCLGQERTGKKDTLTRVGNAMQWYTDYREWPMARFDAKTLFLDRVLRLQCNVRDSSLRNLLLEISHVKK